MPFTLRNLKEDVEDVGSRFDGAPDLEFRLATQVLELEHSGLSYQGVPPGCGVTGRSSSSTRTAGRSTNPWKQVYLCRCGRSPDKPFCDCSQVRTGWTGQA